MLFGSCNAFVISKVFFASLHTQNNGTRHICYVNVMDAIMVISLLLMYTRESCIQVIVYPIYILTS